MDIDSLGEGKVEILYDNGLIKNVSDLYKLKYEDILGLEKIYPADDEKKERKLSFKEKTSRNIMDGIKASLNVPFERVLFALGIRFVGETVAKTLARNFRSMDALRTAEFESLKEIHEIGERIAESVVEWFNDEQNLNLVEKLKEAGLTMEIDEDDGGFSDILEGKSFVVSGTFEDFSRDEVKTMIEKYGGKNTSGLSGKTDYLIAGENSGPAKQAKAKKHGIRIISLKEFLELIK